MFFFFFFGDFDDMSYSGRAWLHGNDYDNDCDAVCYIACGT